MPEPTLHGRVAALERRADESESVLETLTDKVNEVRLGNAKILKNLGALMSAHDVAVVDLTEDETDELFD